MTILVKRINLNFNSPRNFDEINGLFKKAVESIPKEEFVSMIRVSRDRENDEYLVAIFPQYEDSEMRVEGFDVLDNDCECKTCVNYAGAYTHDFVRGTGGKCFADGTFRAPFEQCEWYVSRKKVYDDYHRAVKEAENEREKKAEKVMPDMKESLESIKKSFECLVDKEKNDEEVDPNEQL